MTARRRLLLTVDEARAALVKSALDVLRAVDCDFARTIRLLYGEGRSTGFSAAQRRVVAAHRLLLRNLTADGLDGVVHEELEGLVSLLEREWTRSISARAS